ncbi:amino acid adenylation domain-containing protein [Mycetohabitans sp. B8]|uniref:Polyketide synthase NecC n=1 Tax=Burkholderia sp. B8(2020) TaxID=2713619 RepID=A0A6G6CWY1_9BURK|nr:amino acid adenylation domain-containing protein [Mycetohabitans sp. B8]MCG1041034.1 amino acid adenylation domain-containing protein [Mycetohabitans sp. B8]QIE07362.1 polyketide synthase NecC [Burkholderia sp. B8(2020)]
MLADHVSSAWNRTARDIDVDVGFHHIFETVASARPDALAISDGERALSYAELNERSARLATYLGLRGIGPGEKVAIFMDRSIDLVVAMLAIAKAGAVYIPVDPGFPEQRLRGMLEDSATTLVLTHSALQSRAGTLVDHRCECVPLDAHWPQISMCDAQPFAPPLCDEQLAYVIYTSGSTGQPKGVMIGHRALTNFLLSMAEVPGMTHDDVLFAVTTHCFDISGLELLLPLVTGGQCWLCPTDVASDAHRLIAAIEHVKPTIMQATPTTWMMLFNAGWTNAEQIRILCGGEPLPETLKGFFERTSRDVWNMYGPTETTIWSTVGKLDAGQPVTIGRPIANTRVYIVRDDGSLSDVGEAGELCIAGLGLAQGYLNQLELTAEKFVDNPFEPSGKLYRTGDLARWQADGTIVHLGRIDNQVKIRGYRIETSEIEAHLDAHPNIRRSVVVAREHLGVQQLIAYCVAEDTVQQGRLPADALRDYLTARLPGYMVPAFIVQIDEVPLTPNGKTDRKALAQRPVSAAGTRISALGNDEVMHFIIDEWSRLLGVVDIDTDSRFQDIGGDSVAANLFVTHLNKTFGCALTLSALKDHPTPADIARLVLAPRARQASELGGERKHAFAQSRQRAHDDLRNERRQQVSRAQSEPTHAPEAPARRAGRHDVAIVGMAGKFPLADTPDDFWTHIAAGRNCVSAIDEAHAKWWDDTGAARPRGLWAGLISGIFEFDPAFFRIAPREAELMDPQQRLMLMCAWHALEDAGIAPEVFRERRTGVFVAASQNDYAIHAARIAKNKSYLVTGHMASMIPHRISHALDLFGPSECIETTCSSSLVALHRAVRAIRDDECEQAIVGGINLLISSDYFDSYGAMGLLSADQRTATFQPDASGYVRAEGFGAVILKPLEQAIDDHDTIHAVIKGTSVNHGGAAASLTAPSVKGMAAAICDAIADSGVATDTIRYIEAHGTGSVAGDDAEIDALWCALERMTGTGAARRAYALGGLKPCIGHAEIASGMAALFKVVLAMRHGVIPGIPGIRDEDVDSRWPDSAFCFSADNRAWERARDAGGAPLPRRAGINGYGFGVNAHLIVEEYCPAEQRAREQGQAAGAAGAKQVAVLSACAPQQLAIVVRELRAFLRAHPDCDLGRVIHTLQVGRQALQVRLALVVSTVDELAERLEQVEPIMLRGGANTADKLASIRGVFYSTVHRGASGSADAAPPVDVNSDPAVLARAWTAGARVQWRALGDGPARLSLPHYPFRLGEYRAGLGEHGAKRQAVDASSTRVVGTPHTKRICVVGAGPGGLVMAKSLLEEGHRPVVYEAQALLGGVWNLERNKTVGVYSTTRFQNSKDTSFFSDFYPQHIADIFPNVRDVRAYLEAYADHFDLKRHIHCGVTVISVRETSGRWQVETVSDSGERRTEVFDGVALCHGRYQIPRRLALKGLDTFDGLVLHAGEYYDNTPFVGKRVLVIGNGVSGMDIATEASKVADAVYWSIRSRKFILPRMVGFLPNDFVSPASLLLPWRMRTQRQLDRLELAVPTFNNAFERSGLRPSIEEFGRHPFIHINDEVVDLVAAGRIKTMLGQIDRFAGNACFHRGSGEVIEDIDVVVECSGYRTDALWHYLDDIEPQRDFAMGLFHRRNPMLVNQYGLQEIGVIGTFPYLEMVARWYAQIVSGKYTLSEAELALGADTRQIIMGPLASVVIGMKLGLVPNPHVEFKQFWSLLNRPCFPAQYRLTGIHAASEAADIVDACAKRAFVHGEAQDSEIRQLKFRLLAGLGLDSLRHLLSTGEISQHEYENACMHFDNPLVIDWECQFLTPLCDDESGGGSARAPDKPSSTLEDEYRALIQKLKLQTMDGDDLLMELKKLSRAS